MKNSTNLKKPMLVLAMGWLFLLAAPGNMALALYMQHSPGWYMPNLMFDFFLAQDWIEKALVLALPVVGISLLIQRKSSWMFAALLLAGGCVQNLWGYFSGADLVFPVAGPLLVNGALLVIFSYFRYPYLDKRDRIIGGLSERFALEIPVHMDQSDGVLIQNISKTGCYLRFPSGHELPPVNSMIRIEFEGLSIECNVLRHEKRSCAVKFHKPSHLPKAKMREIRNRFKMAA